MRRLFTYCKSSALQAADGNVFALAGNITARRATGTATRDRHIWLVASNGTAHMHTRFEAANADGRGGAADTTSEAVHLDDLDIHAAQIGPDAGTPAAKPFVFTDWIRQSGSRRKVRTPFYAIEFIVSVLTR